MLEMARKRRSDETRQSITDWCWDCTYDIFPNGAKAAFMSSVVISGLRSPTKTWKWPERKPDPLQLEFMNTIKVTINYWLFQGESQWGYLLLVSFFWLVGVVAQLTLTSCNTDRCRERGRGAWLEVGYARRWEEGACSLIRGFVTHQFYLNCDFFLCIYTKWSLYATLGFVNPPLHTDLSRI